MTKARTLAKVLIVVSGVLLLAMLLSFTGGVNTLAAPRAEPDQGTLEVVKDVDPDDASTNWVIDVTGPTVFSDTLTGDGSTLAQSVISGTYTVTETAGLNTTLDDYTTTYECTIDDAPGPFGEVTSFSVDVADDQTVVCTFTNTVIQGTLEVVKDVDPDDATTNWVIDVSGPTSFGDTLTGDDSTLAQPVISGTYTITETAGLDTTLDDYATTYECTIDGGSTGLPIEGTSFAVDVADGQTVVCTFTNTRMLDHFAFEAIASPRYVDVPFLVTIEARDAGENPVATYSDQAILTDTTGTIEPTITGNFTGGVWTGYVIISQASSGGVITASDGPASGDSNTFDTVVMPECPCSLWDDTATPAEPNHYFDWPVELGVKFQAGVDGYITGLRFYKGISNTGTHIGHLWTREGTLLAGATFTGESAEGWQEVVFDTPVEIYSDTTYIASYHCPSGYFAQDTDYFETAFDNPPLRALADGEDGPNSVYNADGGFPTSDSGQRKNYWVDVIFDTEVGLDETPPTVTSVSPVGGTSSANIATDVTATFSEAMDPSTISEATFELRDASNALVPAAVTYSGATRTATLDPDGWLACSSTYTATVKGGSGGVADLAGNELASDHTWSFTMAAMRECPCSIWDDTATPEEANANDGQPVEVGVKFQAGVDGYITGLRFYKGITNTGTHIGHLWTREGTLLAAATFTGESAEGWQDVVFDTPVAITADTTYVASYHSSSGYYATTDYYFETSFDNPPLRALADGEDGPNGVYKYGASGFPTESYGKSQNYWVDVIFERLGKIIVDKVTDPSGSTQSFEFDPSYGANFFLVDADAPHDSGLLSPGTYSVAEVNIASDWDLTDSYCSDGSDPSSIVLDPAETITCTFVNTLRRGTIIVQKLTVPSPDPLDASFGYTAGGGLSPISFSLKNGQTHNFSDLLPGSGYSVAETTIPAGWDLTSATCGDGSPVNNVDVSPGETVTCTFENTQRGRIFIDKVTIPGDADQSFNFSVTGGPDSINQSFSLKDTDTPHDSGYVKPGDYDASETTIPQGWDLSSATCTDQSDPSTISLQAGEVVTCTFTNTQRGKIFIDKVTDPPDDPPPNDYFYFTLTGPGVSPTNFALWDQSDPYDTDDVKPGTYTVTETVSVDFNLTSISCEEDVNANSSGDPDHRAAAINLEPGELVTCTFTNVDIPSSINVTKTADATEVPECGQEVTYTVVVSNTSEVDTVTITSLTDDIYGELNGTGTCSVPFDLPADDPDPTYACSFIVPISGDAGDIITDTVTASGTDDDGYAVSDFDDATVTLTDILPSITVTKLGGFPLMRPQTGGQFTFKVHVTNETPEPVTLTSLTDTVNDPAGEYTVDITEVDPPGVLTTTCSVPLTVEGDGTYGCSFTRFVMPQYAPVVITDTVTAVAQDDDLPTTTNDSDDAWIEIVGGLDIEVTKTAHPASADLGEPVTFTVRVTNLNDELVFLDLLRDLVDDDYVELHSKGTCELAQVLAANGNPGDSYECSFTIVSDECGARIDTVYAHVTDAAGHTGHKTASATVLTCAELTYLPLVTKNW